MQVRHVAKNAASAGAQAAEVAGDAGQQLPTDKALQPATDKQAFPEPGVETGVEETGTPSTEEGQGSTGENAGTGESDLMAELERTQAMIAKLQEKVAAMGACCGCGGNGTEEEGGGGDKNGKGFSRPTTTRLDGPVSPFAAPTTTTTSTLATADGPLGLCAVFGDPHFITFDGGHTVLVGERVIWLVRTEAVWIQALSRGSTGRFAGFAVGGPFMRGHKLIVLNNTAEGQIQALFDGRPILNETVDEFHEPDLLDAHRDDEWNASRHNDEILSIRTEAKFDIGDWHERFLGRPKAGLFLFKLPSGVEVTVTGVDFMSAVIAMPHPEGGGTTQGGYCGNFNGDPEDDALPVVPSWNAPIGEDLGPVNASLDLFKGTTAPVLLAAEATGQARSAGKPTESPEDRLRPVLDAVAACPEELRREASEKCRAVEDVRMRRDCVFDVCVTKDLGAVDGALAAEILEDVVNAHGVPIFMGHGRCVDAAGRAYEAFNTSLRTEDGCLAVLRALALAEGVRGAQLLRTSICQVLVELGADPTGVLIPGGWGGRRRPPAPGQGLIRGVSSAGAADSDGQDAAAWSCWQLV